MTDEYIAETYPPELFPWLYPELFPEYQTAPDTGSDLEPDPAPTPESASVEVISVDELLDRLAQEEEAAAPEMSEDPQPEETEAPEGSLPPVLASDDDNGSGGGPLEIVGMDKLLEHAETIMKTMDHPALTTSFADYTVTEALLLFLLLCVFLSACVKLLKGGFKWLRS